MLPFVYLISFIFKGPLVAYASTVFVLSVVSLVRFLFCLKVLYFDIFHTLYNPFLVISSFSSINFD